jgi:hypothetical protein
MDEARSSTVHKGGTNPEWLAGNVLSLKYHVRAGVRCKLSVTAFDDEGGTGFKKHDDFIGAGQVDATVFLNGIDLRTGGRGSQVDVRLLNEKGTSNCGGITLVVATRREKVTSRLPVGVSVGPSSAASGAGAGGPATIVH